MTDGDSARSALLGITAQVPLARTLAAIVDTGVADQLMERPQTASALATQLGLNGDALYRVLRMLAAEGIFRENDAGQFEHTPKSLPLAREAEGSVAAYFDLKWQDVIWSTYLALPHTLKTGEPAFDAAHGQAFFDFLAAHPEINAQFDTVMALISGPENRAVARSFDFGRYKTVVDVGAGRGGLMAEILAAHPEVSGVLFDQPQVLDGVLEFSSGLGERCELAAGDFFKPLSVAGDILVLKRIIHDWDDAQAVAILNNCRAALTADGRLLIVEAVLKPSNEPDAAKAQDVGMMLLTPGRERTLSQYRSLLDAAGLELITVHPAAASVSIIEACVAGS